MIITDRTSHHVQQGTPAWLQLRSGYPTASEAPAAQGVSRYMTRSELMRQKATGIMPEHDDRTLARFAEGHRVEKLAQPLAEEYLGEELSNVTMTAVVDGLPLLASLDGINFDGDISWECKLWNESLAEQVRTNNLAAQYTVQMDQQQLVSGAKRTLFTCTDGTPERTVHCWYESTEEKKAAVVMHWLQFLQDVAAYDPAAERTAPAVAAPIESLPAVVVQVQGALTVTGNLDAFGDALRQFIGRMPTKPATDQDFADLEAGSKALKKVEDALDAAEDGALAQISPVEQMRRIKADLKNLARTTRLVWDKLVSAEKDRLRTALVTGAQAQLDQHIQALNQRLGANWLPRVAGGFGEVIKGKKSLANMEDAVTLALTNAKHDANQLADRLEANRKHLVQDDGDWIALFADFATVGAKAEEDFQALAALRIGNHKQAEAARLDKERERIRAEEAARLEREAAAKAQQEAEQERLRIQQQAQQEQAEIAQAQQTGTLAAPVAQDLAGLVQDKAVEDVAGIDAQQAIAAAKAGTAVADSSETITLGEINTMIAPLKIDAAGLAELGFTPCFTVKAAKHYRCSSLPAICRALIDRLDSVLATV